MKTDGILFDLDGTLWDSTENITASWNKTLKSGFNSDKVLSLSEVVAVMGMTPEGIANKLFPEYGVEAIRIFRKCAEEQCSYLAEHGGNLFPGVENMLCKLSETYPLFIVSNSDCGYIEAFLENTGFGKYITDHLCAGQTGLPKSENIRIIAEKHSLSTPVYVGDTELDEASASQAGCIFVHAAYGFGFAHNPDASIFSASDLLNLFN